MSHAPLSKILHFILLYFFLNKTDQEIAELYDMIRQTVTYQRKSILKQLRLYLEMDDLL